jgi:hypothetical protein
LALRRAYKPLKLDAMINVNGSAHQAIATPGELMLRGSVAYVVNVNINVNILLAISKPDFDNSTVVPV